jgi:CRP-like cAMP-binding protein/Ca2+-binding EF-hand superfamily protein
MSLLPGQLMPAAPPEPTAPGEPEAGLESSTAASALSGDDSAAPSTNVQRATTASANAGGTAEGLAGTHAVRRLSWKPGSNSLASVYQMMPEGVDPSIPGIGGAWEWFQRLDADRSGLLDFREFCELSKNVGLNWKTSRLKQAFADMTAEAPMEQAGQASFHNFARWWARHRALQRREMRRTVKELFESLDRDKSGILNEKEFRKLVEVAGKDPQLPSLMEMGSNSPHARGATQGTEEALDAVFDPHKAWDEIKKISYDDGEVGINYAAFQAWWTEKVGIHDPDLPVLPEFMVSRIEDKVKALDNWNKSAHSKSLHQDKKNVNPIRQQWHGLHSKLQAMVRMQSQWGNIFDIYEANAESVYEEVVLPPWTRDPDSNFSAGWDTVSVFFLLYVTVTVPLRACFGITLTLWSVGFLVDLVIDAFFIADVSLNLRTSYYDANGFREDRPKKMALNYIKGWFFIDLLSCLPVGYVQYVMDSDNANSDFRSVKALRLIKMTKMMRLARIKRILSRHGNDVNYQQYMNIGFTVFVIALMVHLLACFFYLLGDYSETLDNGVVVEGWVLTEENWWGPDDGSLSADVIRPAAEIGVGTKYVSAMYYVMNAVENGATTAERMFCVMADFVQDIILGLVASLITTISMSLSNNEAEINLKLTRLKTWMKEAKLPKSFSVKVMQHFNEAWLHQSKVDYSELMEQCPPAMAANMAYYLYGRFLIGSPLFKGMSHEVISAMCMRCVSLTVMKSQTIIRQGEPGKEMYVVMSGEVEVIVNDGGEETRLGFLSEGAFFGEAPILAAKYEPDMQLRRRTVKAVIFTQLFYITRESVDQLAEDYLELRGRLMRFRSSARVMNDRELRKMDMSREQLQGLSTQFKEKLAQVTAIRAEKHLSDSSYVPRSLLPQLTVIHAVAKFKRALVKDGVSCVVLTRQLLTHWMPFCYDLALMCRSAIC